MSPLPHRTPSVGSIVKRITEINPELGAPEIASIIRQSIRAQGGRDSEFAAAEVLDEAQAVRLAQATVRGLPECVMK